MNVGCLFGTFDPPHNGHLAIAEYMLHHADLGEVWLVVTPGNPFKQDQLISPDRQRLAMVKLAVHGKPGLLASDAELHLPRPNYTVDTLAEFRQRWPEHRFALIIGSDNLISFHCWKGPAEILEHHRLLVYPRPGSDAQPDVSLVDGRARIVITRAPLMEISSTRIRQLLRSGEPVQDLLAPEVLAYIRKERLYVD